MKIIHRLVKNGNSTQVTVPAAMLEHLQWRAGTTIVIELTVANSIEIRKPTLADVQACNVAKPFAVPA